MGDEVRNGWISFFLIALILSLVDVLYGWNEGRKDGSETFFLTQEITMIKIHFFNYKIKFF